MYSTHHNTSYQNMNLDSRGRPMPRRTPQGTGPGRLAKPAKLASPKQLDFLDKLLDELLDLVTVPVVATPDETDQVRNARIFKSLATDHREELTLDAASNLIEAALKAIKEARRNAPRVVSVTEGIYYYQSQVVKVQKAHHGSGNLYAKLLVLDAMNLSDMRHEGTDPEYQARWEYTPGLVTKLTPEMKMTLEQAAEFGKLYGVCCQCGAILTDETSISLGIGPVCRTKF